MKLNKLYFIVMLGLALSCMSSVQAKTFHHNGSFDSKEDGGSSQSLFSNQNNSFFEEDNNKFELSDSKHFDDNEDENDDDECWSSNCMPSAVPEPETYIMMLTGLGLLGFISRRRKN
jgi:PEP-CTERM motif